MTRAAAETVPGEASRPNAIMGRLGALVGSHAAVDLYSAFVPPLIGMLQVRCDLSRGEAAWLLGIGSLSSGLSQPLSAWLMDRLDSRVFASAGLALAALCLSCIGLARSYETLLPLFVLGMIGVGVFHPVGAATVGQMADTLPGRRRSLGVSIFFVAGMAGGITGSLVARQVAESGEIGLQRLTVALVPGVLLAAVLYPMVRHVPHRPHAHGRIEFAPGDIARRWGMILILFLANAVRFTVNVTLIYLIVRWAEAHAARRDPQAGVEAIAAQGAALAATVTALVVAGMAIGGLTAGALVRPGREKWPLVLAPVLLAPSIAFMGVASPVVGALLALPAGAAFASMVPVTLSLAQRLLPHRASLASGLMLGGAWAVAVAGPRLAESALSPAGLHMGIGGTFAATAALLACSGLLTLMLRQTKGASPEPAA